MYDVPLFFFHKMILNRLLKKLTFYDELIMFSKNSRLILLIFQPIINPKTDTIRSAEALFKMGKSGFI